MSDRSMVRAVIDIPGTKNTIGNTYKYVQKKANNNFVSNENVTSNKLVYYSIIGEH